MSIGKICTQECMMAIHKPVKLFFEMIRKTKLVHYSYQGRIIK